MSAGNSGTGAIGRSFDGGFTRVRIAFAFRGPEAVAGSYADVGCIATFRPYSGSQQRAGFRFTLDEKRLGIRAVVRGPSGVEVATPPPTLIDEDVAPEAATWRTIDATYTVTDGGLIASGTFDAAPFGPVAVALSFAAQDVSIDCGIYYADGNGVRLAMDIDDVLVELCP